jgi:hypothetical protein
VDAAAHVVQAMSKMKLSFSSIRIKPAEARIARVLFEDAPESIPSMFDDMDVPEFARDLDTFLENTCGAF